MVSLRNAAIFKKELRPCEANGKKALFHEWSHVSRIREAVLIGTESGVIADTFGIVEYETGVIERVLPEDIKFLDNKFADYCFLIRRKNDERRND